MQNESNRIKYIVNNELPGVSGMAFQHIAGLHVTERLC